MANEWLALYFCPALGTVSRLTNPLLLIAGLDHL
jgi:hypothetical protein